MGERLDHLVEGVRNRSLEGRSLASIALEQGRTPFDVAADLVLDESGHVMALYAGVSGVEHEEAWLEMAISQPEAAIETDAILTGRGRPHPAAYGAFPRVLGHFARDRGLFTLEEAVRKMTSLPAGRVGLRRRGLVQEGWYADLVAFNPSTVADRTTYLQPNAAPIGIEHVLVNGRFAVRAGRVDPRSRSGAVLRRGGSNA